VSAPSGPPELPSLLRRLSTDEYEPPPYDDTQRAAVSKVVASGPDDAKRVSRPLADYWSSRLGTATGLLALNESEGTRFYDVPDEARYERAAADGALGGPEVVIDVQTHYMADRAPLRTTADRQLAGYRAWAPDWWSGLDDVTFYGFAEYLRCVFLQSETAVAVLTAPPIDERGEWFLDNDELAGTRELFDRLAGTGRLLNHTVVHPTEPGMLDGLERWRDELRPAGWKVYTMGHMAAPGREELWAPGTAWMLDDEHSGLPFLERSRQLGVLNICSHKGLSGLVDNGSPRDIGPCAHLFPDLRFIVYHSGFEGTAEGPYTEETADDGINRLITTMRDNGIGPGGNVYAELGTTWFCLVKRPREAAHVLGKLLRCVGEDNIVWGSDSIWYGPTQPIIDAFRAFQIPDDMCAQYGYSKLTPAIRDKILSRNGARLYGLDVEAVRRDACSDDLAWARLALAEYNACGFARRAGSS
jgi:hypothetical protein